MNLALQGWFNELIVLLRVTNKTAANGTGYLKAVTGSDYLSIDLLSLCSLYWEKLVQFYDEKTFTASSISIFTRTVLIMSLGRICGNAGADSGISWRSGKLA